MVLGSVLHAEKDIGWSIVSIDVPIGRDPFGGAVVSTERTMTDGDERLLPSTYFQKGKSKGSERKIRRRLHFAVEFFDGQGIILETRKEKISFEALLLTFCIRAGSIKINFSLSPSLSV